MAKASKQDVPVSPARRNFSGRGIAGLLAPVVRPVFARRAPASAALLADWPALAGPDLAARAVPVKLAAGTLTLACTGPAAMELQHQVVEIIARLNMALGGRPVERLRFTARAPDAAAAAPVPRRQAPAPPADLPEGPLGEALARLYQGVASRQK